MLLERKHPRSKTHPRVRAVDLFGEAEPAKRPVLGAGRGVLRAGEAGAGRGLPDDGPAAVPEPGRTTRLRWGQIQTPEAARKWIALMAEVREPHDAGVEPDSEQGMAIPERVASGFDSDESRGELARKCRAGLRPPRRTLLGAARHDQRLARAADARSRRAMAGRGVACLGPLTDGPPRTAAGGRGRFDAALRRRPRRAGRPSVRRRARIPAGWRPDRSPATGSAR